MMRQRFLAGTAVFALALTGAAGAQDDASLSGGVKVEPAQTQAKKELKVGDKAPKLDVAHWLKGEEVTKFEEGKVYVVEFWATWCGPCRTSMPHISKLQEQYEDYGVRFIGISDEKLQTVFNFLKQPEWDEKTQYTMATDPDRSVFNDYMKAAGQSGIPTAFVVGKDGTIQWIGHPMRIDPVIEKVVHDEWSPSTFKDQQSAMAQLEKAQPLLMNEDTAEKGLQLLKNNIKAVWDNAQMLNTIAWELTTNEQIQVRDHEFALKLARRAVELTDRESGMILDTLARIHYEMGDVSKALEIQREAVKHAEQGFEDQLKEWLERYEKEAKNKG